MITRFFHVVELSCSRIDDRSIGFGMNISLCLSKICRKILSMEVLIAWNPKFRRTRLATFWDLDCSRIVQQQANSFQYVRTGSTDGVKRLVKSGQASVRDKAIHSVTLLQAVRGFGQFDPVRFLIEHAAGVNAAHEGGETPLHRAISFKNNYAIAKPLIQKGADVANVAVGNRTPLHAICNNKMRRMLILGDMVEDVGPDSDGISVLRFLAWSSQTTPEVFEGGVASDTVDFWSADKSGRTCSYYVAPQGNLDLLKYLLTGPRFSRSTK